MSLTEREKQILVLIAYENTTPEIARQLFISLDTVKSHRRNLFQKMGARNVAGLVRKGFESRLLPLSSS